MGEPWLELGVTHTECMDIFIYTLFYRDANDWSAVQRRYGSKRWTKGKDVTSDLLLEAAAKLLELQ